MKPKQVALGEPDPLLEGMTPTQIRRYREMKSELRKRSRLRAACPWCLYEGTLDEFSKISPKNDVFKNVECPECQSGMKQESTTILDQGPEEYSRWFWERIYQWRAYEKVGGDGSKYSWKRLTGRVKDLGFAHQFWTIQKQEKLKKLSMNPPVADPDLTPIQGTHLEHYMNKAAKEKQEMETLRAAMKERWDRVHGTKGADEEES